MGFRKFANAAVVRPFVNAKDWDVIRHSATDFSNRTSRVVLQEYDPKAFLLSHCTIVASVDAEESGLPTGRQMFEGSQIDRRYSDYLITTGTSKYVNNNFDAFERKLLLSSFRTFIGGENYCFLAGTQVVMGDGTQKSIEDIKEGDEVLTHLGNIQRVTKTFVRDVEEEICSIYVDRYKNPIKCTKNHPFRKLSVRIPNVRTSVTTSVNTSGRYLRDATRKALRDGKGPFANKLLSSETWVEAGSLTRFDALLGPKTSLQVGGDSRLACLLGYYLSEGCLDRVRGKVRGVVLTFGSHESSLADHAINLAQEYFPGCHAHKRTVDSVLRVEIRGPGIGDWFLTHGGEYSETKRVSSEVMSWDRGALLSLLAAWVSVDAQLHKKTERVVGITVSKDLACQMHRICEIVGVKASLWRETQESFELRKTRTSTVTLTVGGEPRDFLIQAKHPAFNLVVSRGSTHLFTDLTPRWAGVSARKSRKRDDLSWVGDSRVHFVSWVGHEQYSGSVYNFEVEGDNSYVLGLGQIAVHNCEHLQIPELSKGKIVDAAARDIGDSVYIDILVATDRKHKPLITAIESGDMGTLSMGASVAFTVCSKCGNVAEDELQLCNHIRYFKGNEYFDPSGKKRKIAELCGHVQAEPGSVKFIEASWVANPAFTGAVLRSILAPSNLSPDLQRRIQVAFNEPTRVSDPNHLQKAANLEGLRQPLRVGPSAWMNHEMLNELHSSAHVVGSVSDYRSKLGSGLEDVIARVTLRVLAEQSQQDQFPMGDQSQSQQSKSKPDPLKKPTDELYDTLVDKVVDRLKSDIGTDEANKTREVIDENRNENLIRSALQKPIWKRRAQQLLRTAGSPEIARKLFEGLLLQHYKGWGAVRASKKFSGKDVLAISLIVDQMTKRSTIAGSSRVFRTVIAVGGTAPYENVEAYLAACRRVMGRDPTQIEKTELVTKGKLFSLGA